MPTTDRFAGPLAAAWPDVDAVLLARVLRPPDTSLPVPPAHVLDDPMLLSVWGGHLTRLAFDVTAAGATGTFVLSVEEIHPHDAFLGGTR